MLNDSVLQDGGTISSESLLVSLLRRCWSMKRVLENNGKERAEKFKYLEQGLKLCELCALDKSVEVHLLQDVEAGELLAPLVFVQSRQHPDDYSKLFSKQKCPDNPGPWPFKHLLLGCPAAASIVQMVAFFKAVSRSESWMAVL